MLGFARREYTPTYRGFDTHLGFWSYSQSYYTQTHCDGVSEWCGYDFRHNMDLIQVPQGVYSTHYYTQACLKIVGMFVMK